MTFHETHGDSDVSSLFDTGSHPIFDDHADDHDDDHGLFTDNAASVTDTRSQRRANGGRSRNPHHKRGKGFFAIVAALLVVLVVISAVFIVPSLRDHFQKPDYTGTGSGSVIVVVDQGENASQIAESLARGDVVKSAAAFKSAADKNADSLKIQPGTYKLHSKMSAVSALALMLEPSSRVAAADLVVIEGATTKDVEASLVKALGEDQRPAIESAMKDVANAGLPLGYAPAGSSDSLPSTLEGFLYPATYNIAANESPTSAISKMTGAFIAQDRQSSFALNAKAMKISPYEALIIASLVQSEAKFPEDMPKVARVILNRLANNQTLGVDAATIYGAKVNGVDPKTIDYATYDSPYNTYLHSGLPPTPISNPGADAMAAAVAPAKGAWLYYVNGSDDGHLTFANTEDEFNVAVQKCRDNNWGCA